MNEPSSNVAYIFTFKRPEGLNDKPDKKNIVNFKHLLTIIVIFVIEVCLIKINVFLDYLLTKQI